MYDEDNQPNGYEIEDYRYEQYRQQKVDAGTWRPPVVDEDDEVLKELELV